jgi:hypothetical protein
LSPAADKRPEFVLDVLPLGTSVLYGKSNPGKAGG